MKNNKSHDKFKMQIKSWVSKNNPYKICILYFKYENNP